MMPMLNQHPVAVTGEHRADCHGFPLIGPLRVKSHPDREIRPRASRQRPMPLLDTTRLSRELLKLIGGGPLWAVPVRHRREVFQNS